MAARSGASCGGNDVEVQDLRGWSVSATARNALEHPRVNKNKRWLSPLFPIISNRPHRVEPRAVKRRPKKYTRLNRPRHELQQILLKATG